MPMRREAFVAHVQERGEYETTKKRRTVWPASSWPCSEHTWSAACGPSSPPASPRRRP